MMPLIYFIRHGETDWNAELRFQGRQDIALNDKGRMQAQRNGSILKNLIQSEDFHFLTSPLSRTRETMEIIRQTMGLNAKQYDCDDRLRELSFGDWEGHTIHELEEKEPDRWQERQNDKWFFKPPNGESYDDLKYRIKPWLEELNQSTIVVAHGGVNRALQALITNNNLQELAATPVPQDQIMLINDGKLDWI